MRLNQNQSLACYHSSVTLVEGVTGESGVQGPFGYIASWSSNRKNFKKKIFKTKIEERPPNKCLLPPTDWLMICWLAGWLRVVLNYAAVQQQSAYDRSLSRFWGKISLG